MGNKVALLALSALVIAFALLGCGGGGGGTENPVGPAAITGSVADLTGMVSFSGQPLADAAVYLYSSEKALQAGVSSLSSLRGSILAQTRLSDGNYFTKTDNTGRYSFTGVPVGEYTLIAVKDEAHQYARTGVILGSVTTADALLTPTGKVIGRLQLPSGQPVPAAIVHLEKTSYVAISDANGDFAINHVPAGQSFALGIVSTMGALQNSVPVLLAAAEEKQLGTLTLAVPTQQVSNITGVITAVDSSVPAAALAGRIVIVTSSDPSPMVALSDSAGNFSLAVKTPGNYNVSIVGGEFAVSPTVQSVSITLLGTSVGVASPFVLSRPSVVLPPTTIFYTFSGTLIKRNKAFNEADEAGIPVTLTALDSIVRVYSAVTSPTGSFTFSVPAGSYNLAIGGGYAFETAFTNPVAVSANTSLPANLWVVPTVAPAPLFTVGGTALKTLFVNGDTNHAGVTVTLTSIAGAAYTYTAYTDAVGSFSLSVPAGSYNLAVISSSYRPAAVLPGPVNVTANMFLASFNLNPVQVPIIQHTVSGSINKVEFIAGETNNTGVIITLTRTGVSPITYDTVSDAGGSFAMKVAPGSYTLAVSSGYRFATAFANPVDATAGNVNITPAIGIVPLSDRMFVLSGSVNKVLKKIGETSNGDVNVRVVSDTGTPLPQVAVTDALGRFSFKIPAGNYALEIGSGYAYVTPPSGFPYPVSTADVFVSVPLDIRPVEALPARVVGSVSPVIAGKPYTVRIEKTDASYSDIETTSSIGGFSFNELPAGEYNVVVIPTGNGYYAESGPFVVGEGQTYTGVNLSAAQVAPVISATSIFNFDHLAINGLNFLSQPDVAAETKFFIDGNFKERLAGYTLTDTVDNTSLTSVPPGDRNIYIEKLWTRPGTTESWRLKSQIFNIMLDLAPPSSLAVNAVTDTSAAVSWINPRFGQRSVIEIWQAGANIATYSALLGVSSVNIPGLQPLTPYEVRIRCFYGDVVSQASIIPFTTRSNVNYGIESRLLAGTDLFSGDTVFGFEVMNGITYIARSRPNTGSGIFISNYDAAGNPVNTEVFVPLTTLNSTSMSFTSGGGNLFLQYTDGSVVNLQCYNASMSLIAQGPLASSPLYFESQLVYANSKLFSLGTSYFPGDGYFDANTDLRVFTNPTSELATSTIVASYSIMLNVFSQPSAYAARICADGQNLYCARIGWSSTLQVEKFPLSVTGEFAPAKVSEAFISGDFSLLQFVSGGGKLYVKIEEPSREGRSDFFVNPTSGYARQVLDSTRGDYGVDQKGRVWMGDSSGGQYYVQLNSLEMVEKALKVYNFPAFFDPFSGSFLRLDQQTGSFNMLYKSFDGNNTFLSVYHYPATY